MAGGLGVRSTLLFVAMAVGACAGSGSGGGGTYALLRDDAWTLQQAVDPPADDPIAAIEHPPFDWYAAYVRTVGSQGQMVRVTGHRADVTAARGALEALGFVFEEVNVAGWQALGGMHPADTPQAKILILDHGDRSLIALSYELDLVALAGVAGSIEAVDEATWRAAGGIIR